MLSQPWCRLLPLIAAVACSDFAIAQFSVRPNTTADEVLGQRDFQSLDPNTPDGSPHRGNLALSNAAGIAVAPDGRLYVADADNHRILSWPNLRTLQNGSAADFVLGQPDFESSEFNNGGVSARSLGLPQGIYVDSRGNLWVCDAFNNRVLKFNNPRRDYSPWDADLVIGQPDFTSNDPNLGGGYKNPDAARQDSILFPGRVFVRGRDVYVADSGNSRIVHYADPTDNKPLADRVWGQHGDFTRRAKNNTDGVDGCCPTADTFFNPIGVALDPAGNLWVADWQNHRVLRFDDPLRSDTTADFVIGQEDFDRDVPDSGGLQTGLQFPIDLTFDRYGTLFVADTGNNRILMYYDPRSTPVPGHVFGQLRNLDSDAINHGLGPFAADADALFGPTGVAIDRNGNLWIADTNNQRVLRYRVDSPSGPPPEIRPWLRSP